VNLGAKYPITGHWDGAIRCDSSICSTFGSDEGPEIYIKSYSNSTNDNSCQAEMPSFNLPAAEGEGEESSSSVNGGEVFFTVKEYEVYRIFVRIILFNS
jgi:hypothetical protein